MIFLSLLPGLCWMVLFLLLFHNSHHTGTYTRIRVALLYATLLHSLFLLFVTELLSAFTLLTVGGVAVAWSVALLSLAAYAARVPDMVHTAREIYKGLAGIWHMGWMVRSVLMLFFISLIVAILYPTNNYDSLTYHMGRVAHWIQNHSLSYYPTHILRQLVYQPFAEMEILHLQLLTGSDRLAQTVQTFFYAGCLVNVSLITKELGGTAQQQLLSSFFAALIPAVVLESNTTQNDIVVSWFILAFVYLLLQIMKKSSLSALCLAGISLGLAFLTKGTAYLFTLPFIVWLILSLLKDILQPAKKTLGKALSYALIPLIALSINSTFFYRNVDLTGTVLGKANEGTANEAFEVKHLLFVGIKDVMNHLPMTRTMKTAMKKQAANVGVNIDDPQYSLTPTQEMHGGFEFHDDYMKNSIHVILIGLALLAFFLNKNLYRSRPGRYTIFVFVLIASSILYIVLLKWQPWANRLQAPLFLLYCVFLGIEISKAGKRIRFLCAVAMLAFAATALLLSERHPLLPVSHTIFAIPFDDILYPKGMLQCKAYLDSSAVKRIGIFIAPDDPDYLYHRALQKTPDGSTRTIEHVFVENGSAKYQKDLVPDAIISMEGRRDKYILNGREYHQKRVFDGGPVIFEPAPQTRQSAAQ